MQFNCLHCDVGLHVHPCSKLNRGADKSLARSTSWCILFDGENILFDASLVIHLKSTNIPPNTIINRICETQNLLLPWLVSFLVGLRTYQHLCTKSIHIWELSNTALDKAEHKNVSNITIVITALKLLAWQYLEVTWPSGVNVMKELII